MFALIPSLLSLRTVLIVSGAAFVLGTYTGGRLVWELWDVANLKAEVTAHRENQRRIAEVLKVTEKLNTEDAATEKTNEEIYNAIVTQIKTAPVSTVIIKNADAKCAVAPDPVCVDAVSMRNIKRLQ
jgi:hypothetical protein